MFVKSLWYTTKTIEITLNNYNFKFHIVSAVPKLGFGTAGLFEDTKSSVLVALSTGYRLLSYVVVILSIININIIYTIFFIVLCSSHLTNQCLQ